MRELDDYTFLEQLRYEALRRSRRRYLVAASLTFVLGVAALATFGAWLAAHVWGF